MTNLNDYNLSIGLCEVAYGDIVLPSLGDEATFQAIPKYSLVKGGKFNEVKRFLLEQYDVSFEVSFDQESTEMLKYYMSTLQSHKYGYYDSPNKVSMDTNRLVIHPYSAGDSKDYDICIWNAYIDPQEGFQKKFSKEINIYKVKFVGKAVKNHDDKNLINSYFFIGDWSKVGVSNA